MFVIMIIALQADFFNLSQTEKLKSADDAVFCLKLKYNII